MNGTAILRADSDFYSRDVVAAALRGGAHFFITARKDRSVTAATSAIPADSRIKIRYRRRDHPICTPQHPAHKLALANGFQNLIIASIGPPTISRTSPPTPHQA